MPAQTQLATILRNASCRVSEVSGWKTRGHGFDLSPAGGTWHHTAGHNDLSICINGRSDLPGPLCNLYLDQDGVWFVVAAGVAYHAGGMSKRVMDELAAGKPCPGDAAKRGLSDDYSNGNHRLIGVECEGGRSGEAWSKVQIDALVKGSAALCEAYRWNANHWRHHREQTARKVDMSYRGDLRAAVTQALGDDMPLSEVDVNKVADAVMRRLNTANITVPNYMANDAHPLNSKVSAVWLWQAIGNAAEYVKDKVAEAVNKQA